MWASSWYSWRSESVVSATLADTVVAAVLRLLPTFRASGAKTAKRWSGTTRHSPSLSTPWTNRSYFGHTSRTRHASLFFLFSKLQTSLSLLFIVPNRLTYVHPCMPVIPLVPSDSPTLISSLLRLSAHHLALAASVLQPLKSGTLSLYLSVPVPVLIPSVVTSRPTTASRLSTPLVHFDQIPNLMLQYCLTSLLVFT